MSNVHATVSVSLASGGAPEFYSAWEADNEAAASQFPGFLDSEVFLPVEGIQTRWVQVLRFDSAEHLAAWLACARRAELHARVSELSPVEQVIAGVGSIRRPVTVLITTHVHPDKLEAYKAWQAEISARQRSFPGYIDGKLLGPVTGVSDDWTIAMRFDTEEHVDNWLRSKERAELMAKVDAPLRGDAPQKIVADLGGWFQVSSTRAAPLQWKQALCVLLALYPVIIVLSWIKLPHRLLPSAPFAATLLLDNMTSVLLLTWVIMPRLTSFLRSWLQPEADQPRSRERAMTAAVFGALLFELLLFLWIG